MQSNFQADGQSRRRLNPNAGGRFDQEDGKTSRSTNREARRHAAPESLTQAKGGEGQVRKNQPQEEDIRTIVQERH